MWQDEAELANMYLEEDRNRRSSGSSSPGYHFTSSQTLRRNLKAAFDEELPENQAISDLFMANNSEGAFTRPPLLPVRSKFKKSKTKKNFSVYLRIRPLSSKENNESTIEILKPAGDALPTTIRTFPPSLSNAYKMNINRPSQNNSMYAKEFNFDQVIGPETSQETVYSTVAAPLVKDLFDRPDPLLTTKKMSQKSALLFSYGITNAGKTHTVLGNMASSNQKDWGIIPRTIHDIFRQTRVASVPGNSNSSNASSLYISFFEVYNENIYDLMPSSKSNSSKYVNYVPPSLKVRECRGQIFVRGLAKHRIGTIAQGIELTKQAHKKRHTSSNNLNSDSSRSHFVCQMQIVTSNPSAGVEGKLSSEDYTSGYSTDQEATMRSRNNTNTIWIVDLAGSERSKRTKIGGARQKESTKINNSLMTLMRCLNAMKKDGKKGISKNVIPFRDSKLTHIFMGHLTSASAAQTAMMVNVNPSVEDFDETQHVLAYSRKAKLIEIDMKEYGYKRKEIPADEYDQNGRKKPKLEDKKNPTHDIKSKSTLVSRIVQKFSPKKCSSKQVVSTQTEKEKFADRSEEVAKLQRSLRAANDKIQNLENENMQLVDELDQKEDQIRTEVAMEMEERLRETRAKHNEKYEQLKSMMRHQTSKADTLVSMNRAGSQLEDLMDKIDECEKEMIRMTQDHQKEVGDLQTQIKELQRKEKVASKEKAKDKAKISRLNESLKKSKEEIAQLKEVQTAENRTQEVKPEPIETEMTKSTKYKRKLRPRKPLGNSTNQSDISRVFAIDVSDY